MNASSMSHSPICHPIRLNFYWRGSSDYNEYEIKQLVIGMPGLDYLVKALIPSGFTEKNQLLDLNFTYIGGGFSQPFNNETTENFLEALPDDAHNMRIRAEMVKVCIERRLSFTGHSGERISPRRELEENVELPLERLPPFESEKNYSVFIKNKGEELKVKCHSEGALILFDALLNQFLERLSKIDWESKPRESIMKKAALRLLGRWLTLFSVDDFKRLTKEGESFLKANPKNEQQISLLIDFLILCGQTRADFNEIQRHLSQNNFSAAMHQAEKCSEGIVQEYAFELIVNYYLNRNRFTEAKGALDKMPPSDCRVALHGIFLSKKLDAREQSRRRALSHPASLVEQKPRKDRQDGEEKKRCTLS